MLNNKIHTIIRISNNNKFSSMRHPLPPPGEEPHSVQWSKEHSGACRQGPQFSACQPAAEFAGVRMAKKDTA